MVVALDQAREEGRRSRAGDEWRVGERRSVLRWGFGGDGLVLVEGDRALGVGQWVGRRQWLLFDDGQRQRRAERARWAGEAGGDGEVVGGRW